MSTSQTAPVMEPTVGLARPPGCLVTFEGIEGTGKTTQIGRLSSRLTRAGWPTTVTREPGGTAVGERIRAVLLSPESIGMSPLAELMLYVADRAQHLGQVVLPALERGETVLCDRYVDATLAYQGYGRGLDLETIRELHRREPLDLRPRRTVLLDLDDPHTGLDRARRRNARSGLDCTEGRFEAERLAFHERVRDGYRRLAAEEPQRFRIVDAAGASDEVERGVLEALQDLFPDLGEPA